VATEIALPEMLLGIKSVKNAAGMSRRVDLVRATRRDITAAFFILAAVRATNLT
jgi:hypothetical protein